MAYDDQAAGWHPSENGTTIGQRGSEGGAIVDDEEHPGGARITLEQLDGSAARFAITCGIYGWFFHTRFFSTEDEARRDLGRMKIRLEAIIALVSAAEAGNDQNESAALEAISKFVDQFPT